MSTTGDSAKRRTSGDPVAETPRMREAVVVATRGAELDVTIDGALVTARRATPTIVALSKGDVVLVATEGERHFAIGVLRQLREADVVAATSDGVTVRLRETDEGGRLTVHGPDGELWLEHRPGEGRSLIRARSVSIESTEGDLELSSAGRLRLRADEGVDIQSARHVRLTAGERAHLGLDRDGEAQVVSETLDAQVGRAGLRVEGEAVLHAETVTTRAESVITAAEVVTTRAGRIVERARERYQDIAELAQTRAGQIRFVAEKAFRVLGERTLLKARRDVKIKGETIYLD